MDPIELMAIKPVQIKNALGDDCVKIVRGSRAVYNRRQVRSRRGLDTDSDEHETETRAQETRPIWRCTDTACGGKRHGSGQEPTGTTGTSISDTQTDPFDLTHYGHTEEELRQYNVTVLNAYPRDIQDGVVRGRTIGDKRLSIDQRGSSGEVGSQTNLEKPEQPKGNFFTRKLLGVSNFIKNIGAPKQVSDSESSWSSSDEEIPKTVQERDHEWLEHTSTERSQDDMQAAFELDQIENPPTQTRIKQQCFELMNSIKPFLWFLKCGGRWPMQTYVEDRLFKFRLNRWTPNFILFVLTTLFLVVCTTHGIFNIIALLREYRAGGYQTQVQKVLFNKYWPFTFVTLFYSLYASIWSIGTIFDDGVFLAQFMSRWNFGVSVINYNPCEHVRWDMWWSLGWLISYFLTLNIFYIWDLIPAVRGTSELLGMLILNGFVSEINLRKYFFLVRFFGFAFHLYAVFSARMITLWVLMYCKFLENLARRWNIRFCYVFEMLGTYEGDAGGPKTYTLYHTVIPFTKLFTEHKLIAAMSRYTGKIFTIGLSSYFLLKGMEMILLAYSSCCLIIFPPPELNSNVNETALPCPYDDSDCTRVPYFDEDVFAAMTLLYLTGQSWLGWYMTSNSIASCGQAIMSGWVFVRRMGYPRCNNSKERRFIQSLNFSFNPITDYYIKGGFKVNRKFIYEMFSWVVAFTSLIVLFSPFHLRTEVVVYCADPINGTTTCYRGTIPKPTLHYILDSESELKKGFPVTTTIAPLPQIEMRLPTFPGSTIGNPAATTPISTIKTTTTPPPPMPTPPPPPPMPPPIEPPMPPTTEPPMPPTTEPPMPPTTEPPMPPTTEPPMPPTTERPMPPTTEPSMPPPTEPPMPPTTEPPMPPTTEPPIPPPTEPPMPPTTEPPMPPPTEPPMPPTTEPPMPPLPPPTSPDCFMFSHFTSTEPTKPWDCEFFLCRRTDELVNTYDRRSIVIPVMCDKKGRIVPPYKVRLGGGWIEGICYDERYTITGNPYENYKKGKKPYLYSCKTGAKYELGFSKKDRDDCGHLPFQSEVPSTKEPFGLDLVGMPVYKKPGFEGTTKHPCYFCFNYPFFAEVEHSPLKLKFQYNVCSVSNSYAQRYLCDRPKRRASTYPPPSGCPSYS